MNGDVNTVAVLGGGCFWCTESVYQQLDGVLSVTPGYGGGRKADPTYEEVSSGLTGHAEVIKIEFDPRKTSFEELLEVYWATHDPTTPNRQGNDVGSQYRSVILYTTAEQKRLATVSKHRLEQSRTYASPIVTEIKALDKFYPAEDYHQNYFKNNRTQPYCQVVIAPKLSKLRKNFPDKLA